MRSPFFARRFFVLRIAAGGALTGLAGCEEPPARDWQELAERAAARGPVPAQTEVTDSDPTDRPGEGRGSASRGVLLSDRGGVSDQPPPGEQARYSMSDSDPEDPAASCRSAMTRRACGASARTDPAPARSGVTDRDPGDAPDHGRRRR